MKALILRWLISRNINHKLRKSMREAGFVRRAR